MTRSRYITIQEWMLELGIGGNDLLAYALVFGFCQDGKSCFRGSYDYLARWLGCTRRTAITVVERLVELGLLRKEVKDVNGVRFCDLYALTPGGCNYFTSSENFAPRGENSSQGGGENFSPHNNSNHNAYANRDNKEKERSINTSKEKEFSFRTFLIDAGVSADTADQWLEVRKAKKMTNSALALKATLAEIAKSGHSAEDCIRECVIRSWGGFKAEWLAREEAGTRATRPDKQSGTAYMLEQMERRMARQRTGGYDINDLPDEQ